MKPKLIETDPYLAPYADHLVRRAEKVKATERRLTSGKTSLADFAAGHEYFGLHFRNGEWIFREWAPNAESLVLIGDMTGWQETERCAAEKIDPIQGVWELRLPADAMEHGQLYRLRLRWPGGGGDRIPAYARRVVQDPETLIFNAQVWLPETPYQWRHEFHLAGDEPLLIYETHVGMAQEEPRVGTYKDFAEKIIPRIVRAGYNTIQLMAVQEHPYYGSFGYQVSNFFAASSRFGTPEELKELVDTAHGAGLRIVMDIIHSHAASNEVEGLSRFDGTLYQYFHDLPRGRHVAWDSRCFDYARPEVLHFLLSNCRFWLDEYRFDGFRFDGVTSMLYLDHGLERPFVTYDDYFTPNVDEEALTYLTLANKVIHDVRPDAVVIAEDVSGMPGLAAPVADGGTGFDYRFAMGVPDLWIKLIKEYRDEEWPLGHLWYELNNRRAEEKTISYAESHDQALVGDQTIIFRLIGADMYDFMHVKYNSLRTSRGIALYKMIRLITLASAGHGYLNFMGNEFGHPEWIDFPREGNGWSYHYARRQWSLVDHPELKYRFLGAFDREMIAIARRFRLFSDPTIPLLHEHGDDKVIIFERAGLVFAFNFHGQNSYADYGFRCEPGDYRMILDGDAKRFGGHGRLTPDQIHRAVPQSGSNETGYMLKLYLPTRTALVLQRMGDEGNRL